MDKSLVQKPYILPSPPPFIFLSPAAPLFLLWSPPFVKGKENPNIFISCKAGQLGFNSSIFAHALFSSMWTHEFLLYFFGLPRFFPFLH
jgi:hypothetical protein